MNILMDGLFQWYRLIPIYDKFEGNKITCNFKKFEMLFFSLLLILDTTLQATHNMHAI